MDSYRKPFWILLLMVIAVGAAGSTTYYKTMKERKEKIAALEKERDAMQQGKQQAEARVAALEEEKKKLEAQKANIQAEADAKLQEITTLKENLKQARLHAFETRDPGQYRARIAKAFPEMAKSDWGIIRTRDSQGLWRNYLKVPLGMADAYIFRDQQATNLEQQNKKLTDVVALKDQIITLQEKVTDLTKAQSQTYQRAYDTAYANYMNVSKGYLDLLKQPSFKVGLPSVPVLIGCTAFGFLLSTL